MPLDVYRGFNLFLMRFGQQDFHSIWQAIKDLRNLLHSSPLLLVVFNTIYLYVRSFLDLIASHLIWGRGAKESFVCVYENLIITLGRSWMLGFGDFLASVGSITLKDIPHQPQTFRG